MPIAMIGAGYVGLVSAACFSEFGTKVVCVEADEGRLGMLREGGIPFYEPGLASLVSRNVEAERLLFSGDLEDAVSASNLVLIAVGTPMRREDGNADLSHVTSATAAIARALPGDRRTVVATKSTVPVGTARSIESAIAEVRPDLTPGEDFDVASNPEFLREGTAIGDFMRPDRVILGVNSEHARNLLSDLYRPLSLRDVPILSTDRETAELVKYATNGFLATKIAFINEIADICEKIGADVKDVARGLGMDRRIGSKFLHPGPGFGGSCLPKDAAALAETARGQGVRSRIVEAVLESNASRKMAVADRLAAALYGRIRSQTVAVLGLTFKPETDDLREAPSRTVLPELIRRGAFVRAYDPIGMEAAKRIPEFSGVEFADTAQTAMSGADALLILTEWNEFRGIAPNLIRQCLRQPVVVDMRNIYDAHAMRSAGLEYHAVGLASPS